MAMKGTLEAFTFSTLELTTVDEKRATRRELTEKNVLLPKLDASIVGELIFPYFITNVEFILLDYLDDLLQQFNELADMLNNAARSNQTIYEAINLQRLVATINEIKPALVRNKEAFSMLMAKQINLPIRMQILFQEVRENSSRETKIKAGRAVFELICELAGAKEGINAPVKINEAHVNHSKELATRFTEGYIYHWSLEEEIKHIPFGQIFAKITEEQKVLFYQMSKLLTELAKTTEAVYSLNWKHIGLLRRVYCLFSELAFKD